MVLARKVLYVAASGEFNWLSETYFHKISSEDEVLDGLFLPRSACGMRGNGERAGVDGGRYAA